MGYKRIIIDKEKLINILNDNFPKQNKEILGYVSLLISLFIIPFTVDKYKGLGKYITAEQVGYLIWLGIFILIAIIIRLIFKKNNLTKENLLEQIEKNSLNITKSIALFFFLKEVPNAGTNSLTHDLKALFLMDNDWKCYMLPYIKKTEEFTLDQYKKLLSNQLSVEENSLTLKIIDGCEFSEEKNSATTGKLTQYLYTVYFLDIASSMAKNRHLESDFKVGDRQYKWFNLPEVREHTETMFRNREVIQFLDDNWTHIVANYYNNNPISTP